MTETNPGSVAQQGAFRHNYDGPWCIRTEPFMKENYRNVIGKWKKDMVNFSGICIAGGEKSEEGVTSRNVITFRSPMPILTGMKQGRVQYDTGC
nr:hypothetical protein [uncultured Methanoregula sp.]